MQGFGKIPADFPYINFMVNTCLLSLQYNNGFGLSFCILYTFSPSNSDFSLVSTFSTCLHFGASLCTAGLASSSSSDTPAVYLQKRKFPLPKVKNLCNYNDMDICVGSEQVNSAVIKTPHQAVSLK